MVAKVVCLMGPTGVGKTAMAMALSQVLPIDIISVDSAMIYRGMDVGTAKPSLAEQAQAPHQLIDLCEPTESYSVVQFCVDAKQAIAQAWARGRLPLLVGGTMMYFHRLQHGMAALPRVSDAVRQQVATMLQDKGCAYLYERLQSIDPDLTARVHCHDAQRLARGMEVYLASGKPLSQWQHMQQPSPCNEQWCHFAIVPADRAQLHARLAQRFEQMLAQGFEQEVVGLLQCHALHAGMPSMRCVGYRQMLAYLQGHITRQVMVSQAQAATRQLAKRQLTWLRSWSNISIHEDSSMALYDKILGQLQR